MIEAVEGPDSEYLGVSWCPACDPARDPSREILVTQYCRLHSPGMVGSADALIPVRFAPDADAVARRAFLNMIHGRT